MIDNRQSFRLRKQFDIVWSVPDQKIKGEGIIFNISLSGMLFVTDRLFEPKLVLNMRFTSAQAPSFPPQGRLAWFRKIGKENLRYQCGVRFLKEDICNEAWVKWMEEHILKLADAADSKILDRFL